MLHGTNLSDGNDYLELIKQSIQSPDLNVENPDLSSKVDCDKSADLEAAWLEHGKHEAELSQLKDELQRERDLHGLRKWFIISLFALTIVWLMIVLFYIFLSAVYGQNNCSQSFAFHLSDKVMITFVTSTTVSVIGIFTIAAKWLFQSKNGNKGRSNNPQ